MGLRRLGAVLKAVHPAEKGRLSTEITEGTERANRAPARTPCPHGRRRSAAVVCRGTVGGLGDFDFRSFASCLEVLGTQVRGLNASGEFSGVAVPGGSPATGRCHTSPRSGFGARRRVFGYRDDCTAQRTVRSNASMLAVERWRHTVKAARLGGVPTACQPAGLVARCAERRPPGLAGA